MANFNKKDQKGKLNEKAASSKKHGGTVENDPYTGRKEKKVSGKHSGTGKLLYGLRGRKGKPENVERVSEDTEEYSSTTQFIESSLGTKSYAELAPYLAGGVERALLHKLDLPPVQLVPDENDKLGRIEYFAALSSADNIDWQPLIRIWEKRLKFKE